MGSKLSQEEVIKRFKQCHGDKYDYSKVFYENMHKHVPVICPKEGHGIWLITPDNHSRGRGCPVCKEENKVIDCIGKKFGKLTVIKRATRKELEEKNLKIDEAFWWVQCSCGRQPFIKSRTGLVRKTRDINNLACKVCADQKRGLRNTEKHFEKIKDIKFGFLLILRDWGCDKDSNRRVLCECDCGKRTILRMTSVTQGITRSCGCLTGHGYDSYYGFLDDPKHANSDCFFYVAEMDNNYWKPGISSSLNRRASQAKFKSFKFVSAKICRCEAYTIEQIILKETQKALPIPIPKKFLKIGGGQYEIRSKKEFTLNFYIHRFNELLEEMHVKGWEEMLLGLHKK